MKRILAGASVLSIAGMAFAGMATPASANQGTGVYNGMNDSYPMTGIQEVSFTTVGGDYSRIPVWSMDECQHEDGSGTDACVWHAPTRGNGEGGSIVYVGLGEDKDHAFINHEAARILLKSSAYSVPMVPTAPLTRPSAPVVVQSAPVVSEVVPEPVEVTAPEDDITDAELIGMGYDIQSDGTATREPVPTVEGSVATPENVQGTIPEDVSHDGTSFVRSAPVELPPVPMDVPVQAIHPVEVPEQVGAPIIATEDLAGLCASPEETFCYSDTETFRGDGWSAPVPAGKSFNPETRLVG